MGARTGAEISGLEFDWLASDANGHVAMFSTAGGGYAPEEFLRDTDAHDNAADIILALPSYTKARFAPELGPGLKNTWQMMAERGFFAFDSDPNGGPYRLVAAPERATHVSELPRVVSDVVARLVFLHLKFSELSRISGDLLQDA